ncbi:MAG: hypothetical protein HC806_06965 [Anaerolineae bacterium]|nr:hypothetical protein [Anaerolineae bacterium]
MLAPVSYIVPLITIRRTRLLPTPGDVAVRKGQTVRPTDVVATANVTPRHYMLNVARGLGITEAQTEQYIERFMGNDIQEGDIIATRGRIGRRIVRAPVEGTIVFVAGGQVLIKVKTDPFELKAGYPGVVADLIHEQGVVISTTGALVQAIWGNGKINFGPLTLAGDAPNHELTSGDLHEGIRGSVVYAGHCSQPNTLRAGAEARVKGLILSSISAELIPMATAAPYPIIVLDGFGNISSNPIAHKLLTTNQKRNIAVVAEPFDRGKDIRPEVVIPVEAAEISDAEMPTDASLLVPDMRVKITRAPHQGRIAVIETILPGITIFPNGVKTQAAKVRLEENKNTQEAKNAIVPLANLEILG